MKKHLVFVLTVVVVVVGCSGSGDTSRPQATQRDRDKAMEKYLNGLVLDQKGEYAQAILEYQEALQYDPDPTIYHALSKDYSLLGKHAQAIQMGKEAVRRNSEEKAYHQTLAESYARAFEIENSIKEYEEIIRIDSSDQGAWQNAAHLLTFKKPLRALEFYEHIIDRFGPDWEAYARMERLYSLMGRYNKSAMSLRGMLKLDPTNADVKKALGNALVAADSVDAGINVYLDLAELHPDDIALRAALAHAYLLKRDYDEAAAQFEHVMAQDSITADQQIQFGQVFLSSVQRDSNVVPTAKDLFERIRRSHPDDWRPYWFLGALADMTHDDSSALVYFTRVTELDSANADGWVGVASVLYEKGDLEQAVEVLKEAEQILPEEFRIELLLGATYQRMHRPQDALRVLERAVILNDKSIDALSTLGLVYDELGRQADSDSTYERALRIEPNNHLILNNYGYSLADRNKDLDRALEMAQEALEQQPENPSYLDTMGWVYFRLGNFGEAERYIKKAIDLGSTSAVVLEHLGDVYSRMNEKDKALDCWRKALELDPTNTNVKTKIERGGL